MRTIFCLADAVNLLHQHCACSIKLIFCEVNVKLFAQKESKPSVRFVVTLHPDWNERPLKFARVFCLCVRKRTQLWMLSDLYRFFSIAQPERQLGLILYCSDTQMMTHLAFSTACAIASKVDPFMLSTSNQTVQPFSFKYRAAYLESKRTRLFLC